MTVLSTKSDGFFAANRSDGRIKNNVTGVKTTTTNDVSGGSYTSPSSTSRGMTDEEIKNKYAHKVAKVKRFQKKVNGRSRRSVNSVTPEEMVKRNELRAKARRDREDNNYIKRHIGL